MSPLEFSKHGIINRPVREVAVILTTLFLLVIHTEEIKKKKALILISSASAYFGSIPAPYRGRARLKTPRCICLAIFLKSIDDYEK